MKVERVVANVEAPEPVRALAFYRDLFGLEVLMDQGWIVTLGSKTKMTLQVSFAKEGGSGTPVPDLSIEVDDLDEALLRMKKAKIAIEYGPVDEPWGVRRFFVRDPFGKLVNVLAHRGAELARVPSSPVPAAVRAVVPQTFLANVPPALAEEILASGRRIDFARGDALVANPKKPGVTIVVDGLVRVYLRSPEDRQVTARYARPGETLGLVHFMRAKLEVHAQAVTDATLWAVSTRRLRALCETSVPLTTAIAEDCAARVADAIEELAFATFGTVRQRVARHLLDLAAAEGEEGDLVASVTPKSLAEATGSVREVIARVLKDLATARITAKNEHGIVILDAARLDTEARGDATRT